jgi:hypothetical protein
VPRSFSSRRRAFLLDFIVPPPRPPRLGLLGCLSYPYFPLLGPSACPWESFPFRGSGCRTAPCKIAQILLPKPISLGGWPKFQIVVVPWPTPWLPSSSSILLQDEKT